MPPSAGKLFLYEVFARYGAILAVELLFDEDGRPGVGIINFDSPLSAAKAATAVHDCQVSGYSLQVSL